MRLLVSHSSSEVTFNCRGQEKETFYPFSISGVIDITHSLKIKYLYNVNEVGGWSTSPDVI